MICAGFFGEQIMLKEIAPFLVILGCASGCANFDPTLGGIVKFDTGPQPTTSTSSTSHSGTQASYTTAKSVPGENGCRTLGGIKSAADVDTLYARAMRSFDFKSMEQMKLITEKLDRLQWIEEGYKHDKQAGAYYHLAQTVSYVFPSGRHDAIWLDLELSKRYTGADISGKYCVFQNNPDFNSAALHQNIQAYIKNALQH
jgi:hypothetical protein